jgi:hypothetical protein
MILEDMLTLITTETNEFIGDLPETPDNLMAIFGTGGFNPIFTQDKDIIERNTFMITIRDTSYASGYARCVAIKNILNGVTNTTVNGNFYIEIFQVGDINSLGRDTKARMQFTMNFKVQTNI